MGASKCVGSMWTPPQSDKACFLLVAYAQQASKHLQTYMGVSKHMGVSAYTGGCPNIWGHPNIQGASKHTGGIQTYVGVSKHMGAIWTYGGIQTYAGHPNIWGCPNKQGTFLHAFLSHESGFATSSNMKFQYSVFIQDWGFLIREKWELLKKLPWPLPPPFMRLYVITLSTYTSGYVLPRYVDIWAFSQVYWIGLIRVFV